MKEGTIDKLYDYGLSLMEPSELLADELPPAEYVIAELFDNIHSRRVVAKDLGLTMLDLAEAEVWARDDVGRIDEGVLLDIKEDIAFTIFNYIPRNEADADEYVRPSELACHEMAEAIIERLNIVVVQ